MCFSSKCFNKVVKDPDLKLQPSTSGQMKYDLDFWFPVFRTTFLKMSDIAMIFPFRQSGRYCQLLSDSKTFSMLSAEPGSVFQGQTCVHFEDSNQTES